MVLHLELPITPNSIGNGLLQKEEDGEEAITSTRRKILQEARALKDKKS